MYNQTMKKIYTTRKLDDKIVQKLKQNYEVDMWNDSEAAVPRDEFLEKVAGVDGILCMLTDKIDGELLDAAGNNLKTVSTMSVGFDHVDTEALKQRGITLGYTPEVLSDSVADITIALMLNAGRRIPEASRTVTDGTWGSWSPYWMTGHDLSGATVGLVGMGKIAEAVAKRLKGFDCKIIYHSRSPKPNLEAKLGIEQRSLDELLKEADFVSIHAPLTAETNDMCCQDMFEKMKPSAIFVNTSRGGLVNQDDLYNALSSGQIYAAGLDVTTPEPLPTDSPLLKLDNCLVLPHIGSASIKTRAKMGDIAADNLKAGLENTDFVYQVQLQ
jgi:lactate dehydrogenase-like 2-hydroxyacid dehydrogenase